MSESCTKRTYRGGHARARRRGDRIAVLFYCGALVRFWHKADLWRRLATCPLSGQRWGNRPAFLWIAERFGVLRFRLMVKRGPCMRPQASEGEAQHGLFCWTRRVGPGDERLHCG